MRKHLMPVLAALLSAAATDLPYSDLQKTTGVPNLIADMNRRPLAFTVHDGDTRAVRAPAPTTSTSRSRRA
jgi:hypothetical protein